MESGGQYLRMEKIDIPLSSTIAVQKTTEDESLPKEVRESIQEKYELLSLAGVSDQVTLSIYKEIGVYSTNSSGVQEPEYSTYNGYNLKSIVTIWTGVPQKPIDIYSGAPAYNSASTMVDIVLYFGSFLANDLRAKVAIAAMSGGKTIWQQYKEKNPGITKTTGSPYDYIQVGFDYDFYQKYVYVYSPSLEDWLFTLEAQKVVIKDPIVQAQFWDDNGYDCKKLDLIVIGKTATLASDSYNSPGKTATSHLTLALQENMSATIGIAEFEFGEFRWI